MLIDKIQKREFQNQLNKIKKYMSKVKPGGSREVLQMIQEAIYVSKKTVSKIKYDTNMELIHLIWEIAKEASEEFSCRKNSPKKNTINSKIKEELGFWPYYTGQSPLDTYILGKYSEKKRKDIISFWKNISDLLLSENGYSPVTIENFVKTAIIQHMVECFAKEIVKIYKEMKDIRSKKSKNLYLIVLDTEELDENLKKFLYSDIPRACATYIDNIHLGINEDFKLYYYSVDLCLSACSLLKKLENTKFPQLIMFTTSIIEHVNYEIKRLRNLNP